MSTSPHLQPADWRCGLGAMPRADGHTEFRVWAPHAKELEVHIVAPRERTFALRAEPDGYFAGNMPEVAAGARYLLRLNRGNERPDPASRLQPDGVHGPSEVVDSQLAWTDQNWRGVPLEQCVFYELHVGTFTPEGTFDAIIPRIPALRELGVNFIELMPVAQFPGSRNWGYDGVYPYAAQSSYGGPAGLRRLVNACHAHGMGVALDVVYNHLGPEGNYLGEYGPYFTNRYRTPWGEALNFDGPASDHVRRFFIENALYWVAECHIDALRLDAVHAIVDVSALPFLEELGVAVHEFAGKAGRQVHVIAESDRNDSRFIRPRPSGGMGLDAQWSDDFHHSLHALLTGERSGYYEDFGKVEHLTRAYSEGYVYSGQYSSYRKRRHGNVSKDLPARQFVVSAQNHDQVGNRRLGERFGQLLPFESQKLAAGVLLLSPCVPLLFMGEEYGETAPFQYFVSHGDRELIEAVRRGRREEFARFQWTGEVPDPQDEQTFARCRLNWEAQQKGPQRVLRELYAELLRLRREHPALAGGDKRGMQVHGNEEARSMWFQRGTSRLALAAFNFGEKETPLPFAVPAGEWQKLLESCAARWAGPGSSLPDRLGLSAPVKGVMRPRSFVLYERAG